MDQPVQFFNKTIFFLIFRQKKNSGFVGQVFTCFTFPKFKFNALHLRDHVYVARDPVDQLLLGPAFSIKAVLEKTKLKMKDIDVWEIHEAFAGQVLANKKALGNDHFCKTHMGSEAAIGDIPEDKLNNWGGSLSIGHPFGATGVRLITQAAHRLKEENGKFAMISACAAGGHAFGGVIERYPTFKK